jgi:hypothetical protein
MAGETTFASVTGNQRQWRKLRTRQIDESSQHHESQTDEQ